nr:NBid-PhoCl1-CBid [Cloning vector pcDNA-NBid-PhoCl1-CBid]
MDCEVNNGSSLRDECITNLLVFGFLQSCSDNSFRRELDALGHELPVLAPQWEGYDEGSVIPDYFKQSFPEGYSWERSMTYEDGGICIATNDITMEGDSFINKIHFKGTNFPPNGPVMQKRTVGWEASTEKMYERDGVLKGDVKMKLLLKGGGHYRCDYRTTYKVKQKPVKLPDYHFVDHRIEILSHDKDYNKVKLYEHAVARNSTDSMDELYKGGSGGMVSKGEETITSVIKPDMKNKLRMEGNVNGHAFVIEGEGSGKPFEGIQTIDLEVKEGAPLPFAYDILTTAFHYGNRVFTKYPRGTLQTDGNRSSHSRLGRIEADSESQEDIIRNIARHLAQVGDSMDRSIPPGLVNGLALQLRNTSRSEEDRNRDLATALEQLLQAYPRDMEKEKTMLVLALLLAKKVASNTPSLLRDVFHTTVNFINQNLRTYVRSLARNGMTEFLQPVPLNAWLLRLNK